MGLLNAGQRLMAFVLLTLGLQLLVLTVKTTAQAVATQKELETIKVDLAGCVKSNYEKPEYIFKDRLTLENNFYRDDEYDRECRENARKIDFDKYILLGTEFYNAECHGFRLEHKVIKDEAAKLYRFQVIHPALTSPCAGMSHYELFLLVPKLPDGYDVAFEISEKKAEKVDEN
jgi:hypothetical protein